MILTGMDLNSVTSRERHLWVVNHYAISPDMSGGSRHYELARCLKRLNWSTHIFATPFNYSTAEMERNVSLRRPFLSDNVNDVAFRWVYSLPYRTNNWRRYANMLSFAAGFLPASIGQRRPDVIIGSSPHPFAALAAWISSRRHKVPFVLEVRDLWPETLIEMGLRTPAVIWPLTLLERFLYRQADLVIALTEGIEEGVRTRGVPAEKTLLIPNASFKPSPIDEDERQRTRAQLGWQDEVIAIYAGAHGPANALDEIIDAMRAVPESSRIRLVLIGDGSTKRQLMRQANGMQNVTFMGSVPKSEIASILRAADIGILSLRRTTVFEGARPNKLFDYMANGLPVVTTIGGEAERVLNQAGAGLYAPADQLGTALINLASEPDRRCRMGAAGINYVSGTLTREATASLLVAHLDRLLHSQPGYNEAT